MARILIVDDEQKFCENLKTFLTGEGYKVEMVFGGEEALEKLKSFRPNLVLLDIRMPGLSGLDALPRMKELDPNVPIIMVTAVYEIEMAQQAVERGAADYITKPVDLDQLLTSIMVQHIDSEEGKCNSSQADHPDIVNTLDNLAGLYEERGELEEAAALSAQAKAMRKKLRGRR